MGRIGSARGGHPLRAARLSLVLFDIDGTLLLSGGAGVRAMTLAFASTFGVEDAFEGIHIAGRTDTFLLSEAMKRANIADTPESHARFRAAYLETLPVENRPAPVVPANEAENELLPPYCRLLAVGRSVL